MKLPHVYVVTQYIDNMDYEDRVVFIASSLEKLNEYIKSEIAEEEECDSDIWFYVDAHGNSYSIANVALDVKFS